MSDNRTMTLADFFALPKASPKAHDRTPEENAALDAALRAKYAQERADLKRLQARPEPRCSECEGRHDPMVGCPDPEDEG